MIEFGIECNEYLIPIDSLISVLVDEIEDMTLEAMKDHVSSIVTNVIEVKRNNLDIYSIDKLTKIFNIRDVLILLRRELSEVIENKYK